MSFDSVVSELESLGEWFIPCVLVPRSICFSLPNMPIFILYFFHIFHRITLEIMTLQPKCEDVETAEGVAITVTGVAQVKHHTFLGMLLQTPLTCSTCTLLFPRHQGFTYTDILKQPGIYRYTMV